MADVLTFIDERLEGSITSLTPPINPVDAQQPLSFTEWLKYNTQVYTSTDKFLLRYQTYLNNWYTIKGIAQQDASTDVQKYYTNLINDIVINHTSADEQRYLKNLDLTNKRDLAIAVPFFAKKIKDICIYYSTLRDDVKTSTLKYNLKGSNTGIEKLIYASFSKIAETRNVESSLSTLNTPLSDIQSNLIIEVEDLFDTYSEYYDINPVLPASAYNVSSGLRNDMFELNQQDVDPYLFININQSILKAILEYPFYLVELGDGITIDPLVNSSQLNYLKDSDFINTINDGSEESLNIQNRSQEITKYIGSDFYYIVTSSTSTSYTSGQLFTADSEFANYLNKRYPSIAAVPSTEFLKTGKEIGLFFKPDKIGLLNFTNFKFTPQIDVSNLLPDTVYYFPDPEKYGNISGNTKADFATPLSFFEENYFNKIDFSNQYRFGDVISDPYFQTFRAYQSREQTLDTSKTGLSRYIDSQDFFTGDLNDIWSNPDVYPLTPADKFPIQERIKTLLTLNDKTLFQYKTDIYGNEYGLYKAGTVKGYTLTPRTSAFIEYIIDGYTFYDSLCGQGYEFDYSTAGTGPSGRLFANTTLDFTGITIKTSVSEPASFEDGGSTVALKSYDFITNAGIASDTFALYEPLIYTYEEKDCLTFFAFNSSTLPDTPKTDSESYNPVSSLYYYSELSDGAPSDAAPNEVATFEFAADFTRDPFLYSASLYDCSQFYIPELSGGPYQEAPYVHSYTEASNFKNIRILNKDTIIDATLSATDTLANTLYNTRTQEYGTLYFRNNDSSQISPVSSALSALLVNYPPSVKDEILNKTVNFDLFYDTLQIETENYLIFDSIEFDYNQGRVTGSYDNYLVYSRDGSSEFEKFSNTWFDEKENTLTFCYMSVFDDTSSNTNYKIIYPTIYRIPLSDRQATQIYPPKNVEELEFTDLQVFSLFGTGLEINITEIEKPVLNYSDDTGYYTITYLAKDAADCFYVVTVRFLYANNTVKDITCSFHKPATDVYHINLQNYNDTTLNPSVGPYFDTYAIIGESTGYIDVSESVFTYTFGRESTTGSSVSYDNDAWEYIQRAGVSSIESRQAINEFVKGIKTLGLWDNIVCWPMRSVQNAGIGTNVYTLGGMRQNHESVISGNGTWTSDGIALAGDGINANSGSILWNTNNFNYKNITGYVVAQCPTASSGSVQQLMSVVDSSSNRWLWVSPSTTGGTSEYQYTITGGLTSTANTSDDFNTYCTLGENNKTTRVYINGTLLLASSDLASTTGMLPTSGLQIGGPDITAPGTYNGTVAFALLYRSDETSLYSSINNPDIADKTINDLNNLYKNTLGASLNLP